MDVGETMAAKRLELCNVDKLAGFLNIRTISIAKVLAALSILFFGFRPVGVIAQTLDKKQAAIRQQLGKIPMGKVIEVRLLQKGRPRVRGKLLAVDEESFKILTSHSGQLSDEEIAFSKVESVRRPGMRRVYKILISVGAVVAVAIAIASTRGSGRT